MSEQEDDWRVFALQDTNTARTYIEDLHGRLDSMTEQCRSVLVNWETAAQERDAARKTIGDLTRLAVWWRQCKGGPDFKQALDFCANQAESAIRGELPGISVLERWVGNAERTT